MARIVPALQQLLDSGDVRADGLDKVDRRTEIEWRIRTSTVKKTDGCITAATYPLTYHTVRATVERMNRRAGAGLPMAGLLPKPTIAPSKPAAKTPTKKAKKPTAKPAPVAAAPTPPPPPQTNVFIVLDDSGSMAGNKAVAAKKQLDAIYNELRKSSPDFDVQTCLFGKQIYWTPPTKARELTTSFVYNPGQSETHLYDVVDDVCAKAIAATSPSLIYLLTDGEPTGWQKKSKLDAEAAVRLAINTKRITFACVGPKTAANFFRDCGIPHACVRDWDGNDAADLEVVTKQAAAGVQQYSVTRSAGKSTMDSFFVDVVKAGFTAAECRKQLADVTSTLRVRKVNKFDEVETFVRDVLGETYSPGCGYYQIYKAETLKVGRKIILRPRNADGSGGDKFYTGPKVRELLGLPSDRDVKVEPKNLGEFIVYFQSASPNRKLTPDSDFLFDKSHVAGATAPTWTGSRGGKAGSASTVTK